MADPAESYRYFLSYSGVKLPLNLVSPIEAGALGNRNTYFRASYDSQDRLVRCEKMVYGEVELRHDYEYHANGGLSRAVIDMAGDETELRFDAEGQQIRE
ncbi:MAG TPA: DUF6156 family protein [Methylocystis sp.]|nr:DUF6156 family protein [Methylocystis sp.]